jgi:hypothetical protein
VMLPPSAPAVFPPAPPPPVASSPTVASNFAAPPDDTAVTRRVEVRIERAGARNLQECCRSSVIANVGDVARLDVSAVRHRKLHASEVTREQLVRQTIRRASNCIVAHAAHQRAWRAAHTPRVCRVTAEGTYDVLICGAVSRTRQSVIAAARANGARFTGHGDAASWLTGERTFNIAVRELRVGTRSLLAACGRVGLRTATEQ